MGLLDRGSPARSEDGPGQGALIGSLDLGASKIACLIARRSGEGLALQGVGRARPQAGPDGAPLDFDACARAVRIALDQAERMAGATISSLTVAYGGAGLRSRRVSGAIPLTGPVGPKEARQALAAALRATPPDGRALLHAVPIGYRIDDGARTPDPRGLPGKRLSAELLLVTAPRAAVEALTDCIEEAGVRVGRVVAGPYAAGLAVLSPRERTLGAVAIDVGAARTGVAAFHDGLLVLADSVQGGGAALTGDIAQRLATSFAAAEQVKVLHASLGLAPQEGSVEAARLGEDGRLEPARIAPAALTEAIGPGVEELFARVRAKLAPLSAAEGAQPFRAALCGGGSQLAGLRDLAAMLLERPTRAGRPIGFAALDEACAAPAFAVAAGLLRYVCEAPAEAADAADFADAHPSRRARRAPGEGMGAAAGKAWGWLKENF